MQVSGSVLLLNGLPWLPLPHGRETWSLIVHPQQSWVSAHCKFRDLAELFCPQTGLLFFFFFLRAYLFIFRERGEGREKERERNISVWLPVMHPLLGAWPATQTCALTGN